MIVVEKKVVSRNPLRGLAGPRLKRRR